MYNRCMAQEILQKPLDLGESDEAVLEGKIIQEHLELVNMDPWYYIYQVYVNPQVNKK